MIYNLTINVKKIRTQCLKNGKLSEKMTLNIALIEMRSLGAEAEGMWYPGDSEFLFDPVEFDILGRSAILHNSISFYANGATKSCTLA